MPELPVRRVPRRAGPARAAVRRPRRRRRDGRRDTGRRRPVRRAARPAAPGLGDRPAGAAWTTCCAGCGSGSARSAAAAGSTASWSRRGRCSTRRSGRSAPSCSPTRATRPGCARPTSTRCPPTRPRRSGSWPTTTGARRRPAQTFEQLKDLLRSEVLDSQFRGMRQAHAEPRPAGDAAGQGHARRPERDAGRGRPRRAHPGRLRRSSWSGTARCSRTTRRTSRNWSTRWSAGRPRPSGCSRSLSRRAARGTRRADGEGAGGRGAGGGDGPARRRAARPGARSWTWPAGGERDDRRGAARPGRRHQRAGRPRPTWPSWRPRWARTTRARGWTTSTRRRSGAPSAGRPWTTWRRCGGSSGS